MDVRAARLRAGRPGRPVVLRRHRHRHRGRGHAPPAAADHGGGHRAARRAAHAGRPARDGRHRRRAAGDGEDRTGRRGDAGAAGVAVEVSRQEQATTAAVREALEAGRALRIRYYTAGRDDVTRRTVDPMRLLLVEGRGYLEAWCRRAGAVRLFRLDRVDDVAVLDEPAAAPPDAAADGPVGAGCSRPGPSTAARCCCSSPGPGGWPSTTRWSRSSSCPPIPVGRSRTGHDHASGRQPAAARAGPGCCCATPTRPGWSGWCWGSAGERGSWSRPSWRRRWPGARRRRWPADGAADGAVGTGGGGAGDDGCRRGAGGAGRAWWRWCSCWGSVRTCGGSRRSVAALRADTAAGLARLRAIRRGPVDAAAVPCGGHPSPLGATDATAGPARP